MLQAAPTTGDTTIATLHSGATLAAPQPVERAMLAEDKLPVVLAVVLLVWVGLLFLVFRTDRRLARVERRLAEAERAEAGRREPYLSDRS